MQRSVLTDGEYDNVQLIALHSASEGVSGECGRRGGHMEVIGFTGEIKQELFKLFLPAHAKRLQRWKGFHLRLLEQYVSSVLYMHTQIPMYIHTVIYLHLHSCLYLLYYIPAFFFSTVSCD